MQACPRELLGLIRLGWQIGFKWKGLLEFSMLEICILTLFPDMFSGILSESIMKRALQQENVHIKIVNFRDFAEDRHNTVDDYPFGGGAGMLLKPQPLFDAVEALRTELHPGKTVYSESDDSRKSYDVDTFGKERVILLSPQGKPYTQSMAADFARMDKLILLCGHYEGFDHRIRQHIVTDEVSLGDFVLTGGEIAAMAITDSVVRLLTGVLGNEDSLENESHGAGLLEYPQYTRPADFRGYKVPGTLLSGNHAEIDKWRLRHALYRTWKIRPDLLLGRVNSQVEQEIISKFEHGDFTGIDILD
jgi:tRNA (guanine37-N1)-methyltransferase